MRAFDVVKLDFVVASLRAVPGGAEENAAIVMPGVADVHLELEVAEFFVGGEVADAIGVEYRAERLEGRLPVGDVPLFEIGRRLVERRPGDFRWQFADAEVAEADGVGERFEPKIAAAQAVAEFGHGFDIEILDQRAVGPNLEARPIHQVLLFHSLILDVDGSEAPPERSHGFGRRSGIRLVEDIELDAAPHVTAVLGSVRIIAGLISL